MRGVLNLWILLDYADAVDHHVGADLVEDAPDRFEVGGVHPRDCSAVELARYRQLRGRQAADRSVDLQVVAPGKLAEQDMAQHAGGAEDKNGLHLVVFLRSRRSRSALPGNAGGCGE